MHLVIFCNSSENGYPAGKLTLPEGLRHLIHKIKSVQLPYLGTYHTSAITLPHRSRRPASSHCRLQWSTVGSAG